MESTYEGIRPYFLPSSINWAELPPEVQAAMQSIIEPAYQELVVCAEDVLERSSGASLVFLLAEEIVNQFALGQGMTVFTGVPDDGARRAAVDCHLRLVGSKHRVKSFLLRLRAMHRGGGSSKPQQVEKRPSERNNATAEQEFRAALHKQDGQ